jgi:hypothetical protein
VALEVIAAASADRAFRHESFSMGSEVNQLRMQSREERIARTDSTFRDANEKIATAAAKYELVEKVPFICECATESCTEIVHLSLAEYEEVRSVPTRFFVAPGHLACEGVVSLLEDREGYIVLEKEGRAGEVATELDPRSDS